MCEGTKLAGTTAQTCRLTHSGADILGVTMWVAIAGLAISASILYYCMKDERDAAEGNLQLQMQARPQLELKEGQASIEYERLWTNRIAQPIQSAYCERLFFLDYPIRKPKLATLFIRVEVQHRKTCVFLST